MPKSTRVPKLIDVEDGDQESEKIKELGFHVVKCNEALDPGPTPEEALSKKEQIRVINKILSSLTNTEAEFVRRHLMGSDRLEKIARELGIPMAKIRRTSACVMRKLRRPMCADKLRKFLK